MALRFGEPERFCGSYAIAVLFAYGRLLYCFGTLSPGEMRPTLRPLEAYRVCQTGDR